MELTIVVVETEKRIWSEKRMEIDWEMDYDESNNKQYDQFDYQFQ
jgi:hypothetical protein